MISKHSKVGITPVLERRKLRLKEVKLNKKAHSMRQHKERKVLVIRPQCHPKSTCYN
jgi:hypothetical protein